MQVIGVVAPSGCGKNELGQYLSDKYGMAVFSIGRLVEEITEKRGHHTNRENLQKVSAQIIEEKGPDFLARTVIEAIEQSGCEKAVIVGVRTPQDVRAFRDRYPEFLLVSLIIGDQRARFARTAAMADVTIRNVGTSAQLQTEIDLRIASRLGLTPVSPQET
ncbi:MAG: AAA family ATPase [Acidobacteriota bacterium]